jgi:O-antigen ligase
VTWSVAPELSYVDAGRMLAFTALFAGAIGAARLAPNASQLTLKGLLVAATAVCLYALASRVWPASLAEDELANRIGQPYGYWNAVGSTAALAVPAALWLGSRRGGSVAGRVLAYPALGIAFLTLLLTQSRGALAAAALCALAWFAVVPLRLRSLPVLLLPALAVAPVSAWALSQDAFSEYAQPLAVKESVADELGLLVLALIAGLTVAGAVVNLGLSRIAPPVVVRRRIGMATVALACAVPLVLFTSVAFSDRGLGGTIDDRVDELTSETAAAPAAGAGRLAATSNSRSSFWREAGKVYSDRPAAGTGAGTFAISRLRYRKNEQVSRHAHGFVPQTLSDLGLIGLGLSLALLLAWLVAAARATALYPRLRRLRRDSGPPPRRDWTADRTALVALALVALAFGLQSNIDWTWFVPGPAVMALVAAGFVAGHGPPLPARPREARPARGLRRLASVAIGIAAILAAWAIWQPEGSDRGANEALALSAAGDNDAAIAKARDAEDANRLAPKPLLVRAAAQTAAGREGEARRTLERAVLRFPGDPQTWLRLAGFQLGTLDRPQAALRSLDALLYLDPKSKAGRQLFLDARARLRTQQRRRAERRSR